MAGTFRSSGLRFLNETEEFRHGVKVAMEVLQNETVLARARFVTSLSTERDALSQWRAYGGEGPHFSVGFLPDVLETTAGEWSFALDEVRYRRSDMEAELRLTIHGHTDAICARLPALQEDPLRGAKHVDIWAMNIVSSLMMLIPRYKHEKFHGERASAD